MGVHDWCAGPIFQFEHPNPFTQTQPSNQNQTKREKNGYPQETNHSTDRRLSHKRVLNSVNSLRYIWILIPTRSNCPHRVQNGGVISATKVSTNLFQTVSRVFASKPHTNLPGKSNRFVSSFRHKV